MLIYSKDGGTWSIPLQYLLYNILNWCIKRDIVLRAVYLPGVDNSATDLLSHSVADQKEWSLPKLMVDLLFNHFGTPSINLFASRQNIKLPVCCSLYGRVSTALGDSSGVHISTKRNDSASHTKCSAGSNILIDSINSGISRIGLHNNHGKG